MLPADADGVSDAAAGVVMASLWAERVSGPCPCIYRLRSPWSILRNSYLHRTLQQRAVRGVLLYAPSLNQKQAVSNRREPWSCVCSLTLFRTRADPAPLTTPRLRLDGGMIGEQSGVSSGALLSKNSNEVYFFANIKGFMGFIEGTI